MTSATAISLPARGVSLSATNSTRMCRSCAEAEVGSAARAMRKARRRRIMRSPIAPAATGSKEKAAPEGTAPSVQSRESGSALGDLEAAAGLGLAVLLAFHHQLGRASCRERVCQYEEIQEVPGD